MAAVLAGENVEQEYLWTCTLSGATKEYNWAPETAVVAEDNKEGEEKDVKPGHRYNWSLNIVFSWFRWNGLNLFLLGC